LHSAISQRSRLQQRCASQTGAGVQPRPQPMPAHSDSRPCGNATIHSPDLRYSCLHQRHPSKLHGLLRICRPRRDGRL